MRRLRFIPLILLVLLVSTSALHAADLQPARSTLSSSFAQIWGRLLDLARPEGLIRAVGFLGHEMDPNGGSGDLGHTIDPDGGNSDLGHTIDPNG